jgi:hypothetical protein
MISATMIKAALRIRIILSRIHVQIALFHSNADPYPDTNFNFNVDPDLGPAPTLKLCESATTGQQALHASTLSLHASIVSVHCPPNLRC